MLYNNIIEAIGKTPLVKLENTEANMADIYVKVESFNPGGSVKDRAAYYMIKTAAEKGLIKQGDTIIEATSGNMGISLSMIGAALGYKMVIVMPDTMSVERRKMIAAYGAELVLTPGSKGMLGSVEKAQELAKEKGYFVINQFKNMANFQAHVETTAVEIYDDLNGELDAFVAGVGTGGTVSGIGSFLKSKNPAIQIIAIQPDKSPVLTGGNPGPHGIQGIGANFVPEIYKAEVIDEVLSMNQETAYDASRELGKKAGILVGMSAGGNFAAAKIIAKRLGAGKKVVTILPDTGERYLSTVLFDEE
ncbi:cysteine synthase A [Enterococcus eurekensis]|uniref:Cysteine synthase n=1 Tax=Enterococcus eurekensis TaxID=1159753 RepID=A0ABV9M7Y7_9ENTE